MKTALKLESDTSNILLLLITDNGVKLDELYSIL